MVECVGDPVLRDLCPVSESMHRPVDKRNGAVRYYRGAILLDLRVGTLLEEEEEETN